jgi:hypothetical protein
LQKKFNLGTEKLVEALCYNPEGRGFDLFQPHYGPGVYSVPNRNDYQESSFGKVRPVREPDNLSAICEPIV